jgi:hypothetical protein
LGRLLACLLLATAALAACGGDDESAQGTRTVTETTTETAPGGTTADTTSGTGTNTETESGSGCPGVTVLRGDPSCAQMQFAVSGYATNGPKVQELGAYTCEGGEADTRPITLTCIAGDNEFTASKP